MPPDDKVPPEPATLPRILPFPRRHAASEEAAAGSAGPARGPGEEGATVAIDEASLVRDCQRGDRQAMERLYLRYRRRVYSLVARIGGAAVADELSQEVFLKIYKNISKFRGDSQLGTWIYRLTVNATLTYVTRRPRDLALEDQPLEPPAAPGPETDPALRARIERALAALPAGYRAVLVLHDVEGQSHEEIAEVLGCRVGTSKSQLHKARARMRELLGPLGR
jgi:RNA polymerase sigma-70 factor (ECF subfamily)